MSSGGYHHRSPPLLMLDDDPLRRPSDLDDTFDNDDNPWAYAVCAGGDDLEAEGDLAEEGELAEEADLEEEEARVRLKGMSDAYIELEKIPPRLWEQTLAPLQRQQRYAVAQRVPGRPLRELATTLAYELDMGERAEADTRARARNAALRTGYALPTAGPGHASARSSVQVNLRLRRDDHERLAQAATAVGLKPTTLARSLVLNGAAMILREQGKEHLAPPRRRIYTPLRLE